MAELTPMKRQYNEIKSQHQDCLLFFCQYHIAVSFAIFDVAVSIA